MGPPNSKDIPKTRRPHKRSRKSKSNSDSILPPSAYILNLPFELLAEILCYTASPKDVLAVARCSKYLCTTLLRPESAFIWRSVRNCLPGPLPDPQPINLSESAFAALVFDGGNCDSCGTMTLNMYSSWSLRVRFCSRPECRESWARKHTRKVTNFDTLTREVRKALAWIPLAESPACFSLSEAHMNPSQIWPQAPKIYRISAMNAALTEYATESSSVVDKRHAAEIAASPLKMSFFVALYTWRHKRQLLERQVKIDNETFGKELAQTEGYVYAELLNGSATYQNLHVRRTKNLELITRLDYDLISTKIDAEMVKTRDRQERRTNEATIQANRAQVEQHHQRLISLARATKVPSDPLPSLAYFRAMPVLGLLQTHSAPVSAPNWKQKKGPDVAKELQGDTVVNQLLASELTRWRKGAETVLGATLGIPEWKTARNNKLHPVARLTARWNCGNCGKVAGAYKWDACLDYQGACKHECAKSKKGKEPVPWTAEQFVKDDKAINAMTQLLKLCGIDAEDPGSYKALDDIGPRIQCLSCPAAIVMRPSSVPGHSHRHDEMNMTLLAQAAADALVVAPIEKGLTKRLMGHDDFKVKREQKAWRYGCRHCEQHIPPPPVEKPATEPEVAPGEKAVEQKEESDKMVVEEQPEVPSQREKNPKKQPKGFEFNGLRSHLKEKHSIALPHDEDFYHVLNSPKI